MHIKFLARGTGSAREAADYLLGARDATGQLREGVEVLRGDPHPNRRRHVAMRQRTHVPRDTSLRSEHRPDAGTRVVRPEIHRHLPLHGHADALMQVPGGGHLLVPDRSENPDHVGARHPRDRHPADSWEGMHLHGAQPQLRMLGRPPARPQLLPDPPCRLREGGHPLGPPLFGKRIAPSRASFRFANAFSRASFSESKGLSAEPELGSAAPDREPLDPAAAARIGNLRNHLQESPLRPTLLLAATLTAPPRCWPRSTRLSTALRNPAP